MDITPRTRVPKVPFGSLIGTVLCAVVLAWPAEARPYLAVWNASTAQAREVDDAVSHFRAAGLELPPLEVEFHSDPFGCQGRPGYYAEGVVDICTGATVNLYSETLLIHEMAHAWSERAMGASERRRFLELLDLPVWSSWDAPWSERGWEHAAEIIRWGIFGVTTPRVPYRSIDQLEVAYEFMTGTTPPILGQS